MVKRMHFREKRSVRESHRLRAGVAPERRPVRVDQRLRAAGLRTQRLAGRPLQRGGDAEQRATAPSAPRRPTMRELAVELKQLRMHGMAGAWADLVKQGGSAALDVVLVGGPGTGETHLATAIGVSGITRHGKRVRSCSTVDVVNALEQEKTQGKVGRIALSLLRMDLVSWMGWATCRSAKPAGPCWTGSRITATSSRRATRATGSCTAKRWPRSASRRARKRAKPASRRYPRPTSERALHVGIRYGLWPSRLPPCGQHCIKKSTNHPSTYTCLQPTIT
jgi:hypothetical protein